MKKLLTISGLITALAALAAPEESVTKSASGSTAATVYFEPGPRAARLVVADVTSDKAASVLSWKVGAEQVILLKAALANGVVSNLTTTVGTIASGTNCVTVRADGTVTPQTAFSSTLVTNKLITLHNPIGTNLAVGDTLRELDGTPSTLLQPVAAGENLYFLAAPRGWAADDLMVFEFTPGLLLTNTVATYVTNSIRNFAIAGNLPTAVAYGAAARELGTTNSPLASAVAADSVNLHVTYTNGFVAGAVVAVLTSRNTWHFGTIDSGGVTLTNVALATALGVPLTAGDLVYPVTTQAYTCAYPAGAGETTLNLDVSTGLAAGDSLIVAGSDYTWRAKVGAAATTNTTYTATAVGVAQTNFVAGSKIHAIKAGAYATTFTATETGTTLVADLATNLAAADQLLILPASGGVVRRQISGIENYIYKSQNLLGTNAVALAVGDRIFVLGTAVTTPVGAATLRLSADPLRALPANTPGVLSVDGTSACTINAATVKY